MGEGQSREDFGWVVGYPEAILGADLPGDKLPTPDEFYERGSQEKYLSNDRIFLTFQLEKLSWICSSLPLHELGLPRTIA